MIPIASNIHVIKKMNKMHTRHMANVKRNQTSHYTHLNDKIIAMEIELTQPIWPSSRTVPSQTRDWHSSSLPPMHDETSCWTMTSHPFRQRRLLKKGSEQQRHLPQNEHASRSLTYQPISSSHLPPVTTGQYEFLSANFEYRPWPCLKKPRLLYTFLELCSNLNQMLRIWMHTLSIQIRPRNKTTIGDKSGSLIILSWQNQYISHCLKADPAKHETRAPILLHPILTKWEIHYKMRCNLIHIICKYYKTYKKVRARSRVFSLVSQ